MVRSSIAMLSTVRTPCVVGRIIFGGMCGMCSLKLRYQTGNKRRTSTVGSRSNGQVLLKNGELRGDPGHLTGVYHGILTVPCYVNSIRSREKLI